LPLYSRALHNCGIARQLKKYKINIFLLVGAGKTPNRTHDVGDLHPLAPRTRGSNNEVRISARFGRPIKTTPSPSPPTVVAGGAMNTSPSRRLISMMMKKAPWPAVRSRRPSSGPPGFAGGDDDFERLLLFRQENGSIWSPLSDSIAGFPGDKNESRDQSEHDEHPVLTFETQERKMLYQKLHCPTPVLGQNKPFIYAG
jgi:hypothetical protein